MTRCSFVYYDSHMLKIENLSKHYDGRPIFCELNYRFGPGCQALCEEENTGKSTLLRVLAGITSPDTGDVWVDGHSMVNAPASAKARLAYVPSECSAEPGQTGLAFLREAALAKGSEPDGRVLALAGRLGLEAHLDKQFFQMSTGTRRKVYLAAAAIGAPAVVLADGPTDGLDRQARMALADQFVEWSQDRVVLFATHDAAFVQACDARVLEVAALC